MLMAGEATMTSLLEFSARAALCRHLAMLEPNSRYIWLAEAERWARLTRDEDEPEPLRDSGGMSACLFVKPGGN
jgi:hypothetical protein